MKSIFAALMVASTASVVQAETVTFDTIVQQGSEHLPVVWDAIKTQASKIPLTKREAIARASIDPKTGKPFIMTFPADMQREYDQAFTNVLMMRKKEGFHIPKRQSNINNRDSCMDTETFGTLLGFAYGLQYDTKVPGECYNNLESTILALDTIF